MRPRLVTGAAIIGLTLLAIGPRPALAQSASVVRTFVSGTGADTSNCVTPSKPCRTFAYALTQTSAGGTIVAQNAAEYGPVSISQAVSIIGPGKGLAMVTGTSGNAVTINASGAVTLRGLEIVGGFEGVEIDSAGVEIADSVIRDATNADLYVFVTGVTVRNTTIIGSGAGIVYQPSNASDTLTLKGVTVLNGATAGITSTIGGMVLENCVVSGTGNQAGNLTYAGLSMDFSATALVKGSTFVNNAGQGVYTARGATVTLDTTTITGNGGYGLYIDSGGAANSYKNNNIVGNTGGNVNGTLTPVTTN